MGSQGWRFLQIPQPLRKIKLSRVITPIHRRLQWFLGYIHGCFFQPIMFSFPRGRKKPWKSWEALEVMGSPGSHGKPWKSFEALEVFPWPKSRRDKISLRCTNAVLLVSFLFNLNILPVGWRQWVTFPYRFWTRISYRAPKYTSPSKNWIGLYQPDPEV